MQKKIALIGKRRAGKDTVASYLCNHYGYFSFAFGEELKKRFHKEFPQVPKQPKPSAAYQHYGQLMREVEGENVWVDACFNKINEYENYATQTKKYYETKGIDYDFTVEDYMKPIITDVRQHNEVSACRDDGYIFLRVYAPEETRVGRIKAEQGDLSVTSLNHSTETELDLISTDYTIFNEASLDETYKQIDELMQKLGVS